MAIVTLPGRNGTKYRNAMIELLTNAEMAEADQAAIASGTPGGAAHGKRRRRGGGARHGPPPARQQSRGWGRYRQQRRRRVGGGSAPASGGLTGRGVGGRIDRQDQGGCRRGTAGMGRPGRRRRRAQGSRRHRRCAVRRGARPAGNRRCPRRHRGHQPGRLSGRCRRPSERNQRHQRRRDGVGCQGRRDRHLLSQETRAPASSRPRLLRCRNGCRDRDRRRRARRHQALGLRERPGAMGRAFSGAHDAGAQIQPRPCRGGVGLPRPYRGGAPCRHGGVAGRRRARHHRVAARRARRQCGDQSCHHGAARRGRHRIRAFSRRPPV